MKKYKLLKDLPFAKAGAIFIKIDDNGTAVLAPENCTPHRHMFPANEIQNFEDWFEEINPTRIKHWYITHTGDIIQEFRHISDEETSIEDARKEIGNYFETEEEAKKHLEWLKARATLLEDTKGFKPDWTDDNQLKYHAYYDYNLKLLNWDSFYDVTDKQLYFKAKEDVKISIQNHEKEWKIYLGVE